MKAQKKNVFFAGIVCLAVCTICIWFFFSHSESKTPVLRGTVDTISLYAHNLWFSEGEFQKKEITNRTDVEQITDELTSVRYQDFIFPPDDLGGGWMLTIELHYHDGAQEFYRLLFDEGEQVVVYPPSGRSVYGTWPDGESLWDRVPVPAQVITGDEMPKQ